MINLLTRAAYRWPVLRDFFRPQYRYQLQPPELIWLCNAIDRTRHDNVCVVEVGVARGKTSVFLLEYMRTTFDPRPYYCIDTFAGFLKPHVEFEVTNRGKRSGDYIAFSYTHRPTFVRNIRKAGFKNCHVIQADAAVFDWASIAPINVMLIDVDLYLPTMGTLEGAYPHISGGGAILVDNVEDQKNLRRRLSSLFRVL